MSTAFKGTTAIVFSLVCLILKITTTSSTESIHTKRQFDPDSALFFSKDSFDGRQLAYVSCDDQHHCQVFLETLSSRNIRSCNMTLYFTPRLGVNYPTVRAFPLGADRLILVWMKGDDMPLDEYSEVVDDQIKDDITIAVGFTTVAMDNCTVLESSTRNDDYLDLDDVSIVPYDDQTYDIIQNNMLTHELCRWTVDTNRKRTSAPYDCFSTQENIISVYPLAPGTPSKGFLMLGNRTHHWIVVNGKPTTLNLVQYLKGLNSIPASTSHDKVTVCKLPNCWQFNHTGHLLNHVHVTNTSDRFTGAVYNLKDGGLLVATGVCKEGCRARNLLVPTYYVTKYNKEGQSMRTTIVQEFKCNYDEFFNRQALKFYEDETGKVCLMMACYRIDRGHEGFDKDPHLDVVTTCFD